MKLRMLVIGYGNELRQDDGVGPRLARIVAGWQRPGLEGIAVHQLSPELAERLNQADHVVFVDAGLSRDDVRLVRLEPGPAPATWGHACDPQTLLALTEDLYGVRPEAWLMEMPAACLGFGVGLSRRAEQGLQATLQHIRRLAGIEPSCTRSV